MPENESKDREAWEVGDMIRVAGGIVENALRAEDEASRKALRDAHASRLSAGVSATRTSMAPASRTTSEARSTRSISASSSSPSKVRRVPTWLALASISHFFAYSRAISR